MAKHADTMAPLASGDFDSFDLALGEVATAPAAGPRVALLVYGDDETAARILAAFEGHRAGIQVVLARSLGEARGRLGHVAPALVLLDRTQLEQAWEALALGDRDAPDYAVVGMTANPAEALAPDGLPAGVLDLVATTPEGLAGLPRAAERALREWDRIVTLRGVERRLEESEARFQEIVAQSQDLITIIGPHGTIYYESPSIEALLGYGPEELTGRSALERIHPEDRERVTRALAAARERPGTTQRVEYRFLHKDGSWRVFESLGRFHHGNVLSARQVVTSRDITPRLRAQEERLALEAQLHHAQKLETIGTLAGGIAHDFNNILTSLFGFASLVVEGLPEDSPVYQDMLQVMRSAERAKDLVKRILTFSRQVEPERCPVEIAEVVSDSLLLARASFPSSVVIESRLDRNSGRVDGDASQLQQVVLNLCTNAAHAMRQSGGTLTVELRSVDLDDSDSGRYTGLPPGRYARLDVSDTGHGMDGATLARVFEPFFTTKAKGEGTGLGLAVVHGIVASHAGQITASSRVGEGSRFTVLLPTSVTGARAAERTPRVAGPGSERILFVDDEIDVIAPVERLLAAAGYAVSVATNAVQALELVGKDPEAFDLVLTDRTMPGMSGPELAEALHGLRSDLPVVLVSGYGVALEDVPGGHVIASLAKPFTFQELSSTIRRVLDR